MLHDARTSATIDEVERSADDILLPLCGATLRSALAHPTPVSGIELQGTGLAFSSAKESEDGEWLVLRCVNLLEEPCPGHWRLGTPVVEARLARLDETIQEPARVDGDVISFIAPPRGIVTILTR
jgi:hypothetical protein